MPPAFVQDTRLRVFDVHPIVDGSQLMLSIPLHGNFGNCGTPVKTKLLSVNFELGPWQICWKFSDL